MVERHLWVRNGGGLRRSSQKRGLTIRKGGCGGKPAKGVPRVGGRGMTTGRGWGEKDARMGRGGKVNVWKASGPQAVMPSLRDGGLREWRQQLITWFQATKGSLRRDAEGRGAVLLTIASQYALGVIGIETSCRESGQLSRTGKTVRVSK